MEFNKCCRCGNFYVSNEDVCPKCKAKDNFEFGTFQSYIGEHGFDGNIDLLAVNTGIASKNISRFVEYSGLNLDIPGNLEENL